jgi:hypothetical protein
MPPSEKPEPVNYVAIGDKFWPEASFLAAVNTVGLETLKRVIEKAEDDSKLLGGIGKLRTVEASDRVRLEALRRVQSEREGLTLAQVRAQGGRVVATFPAT